MNTSKGFILPFLISVAVGILLSMIIIALSGYNPIHAMTGLFITTFTNKNATLNMGYVIIGMAPIILTGLSVAFAFKTGLFNIGAEGQFLMGSLFAVSAAIFDFGVPRFIHVPIILFAAFLGGALWGLIPGLLKAYFKVNEVVVTIMLNYVALEVLKFTASTYLTEGDNSTSTRLFQETSSLRANHLVNIFGAQSMNIGIYVAIISLVLFYVVLYKTRLGFELRAVGFNNEAARYSGMSVNKSIIISMFISGGLAGLGGAIYFLGLKNSMDIPSSFINLGYTGITIALLGGVASTGILLSSLLISVITIGKANMTAVQFSTGDVVNLPTQIADIMVAMLLLVVAMQIGYRLLHKVQSSKKKPIDKEPPKQPKENEDSTTVTGVV